MCIARHAHLPWLHNNHVSTVLPKPLNKHQTLFLKIPFHTNSYHMDTIHRIKLQ